MLIDFNDGTYHAFAKSYFLTKRGDVRLVPTHGHSAGHMSALLEEDNHVICFAGDASYTQQLMLDQQIDGIAPNVQEADYFGMTSGRTVDKFKETGLTPVKSELVDTPYVGEFPTILWYRRVYRNCI